MNFTNRRVLVTGSTRGVGRVVAERFLSAGARVAINGRSDTAVRQTIEELGGADQLVDAPGDLSSAAACDAVVQRAVTELGGLDVLVNNAGIYVIASVEDSTEAIWDTTMAVNVKSMFFCSRAPRNALREGGGVIVNHASNAGLQGFSGCVIYSASKGAVVNMTRALAMEFAPEIRVNCVCPSTLDNEMGWSEFNLKDDPQAAYEASAEGAPLKRVGTSKDAAAAITFLASDDASFINGIAVPVDGGKAAGK